MTEVVSHEQLMARTMEFAGRIARGPSLAIEVAFQPKDRTLTDTEIEAACQKVVAAVAKVTGLVLSSTRPSPSALTLLTICLPLPLSMVQRIDGARISYEAARDQQDALGKELAALRTDGLALKQQQHEKELEQLRLVQESDRCTTRYAQIDGELAELAQLMEAERVALEEAGEKTAILESQRGELLDQEIERAEIFASCESALGMQREVLQQADRDQQAAHFAERNCAGKVADIAASLEKISAQLEQAAISVASFEEELAAQRDEGLREQLQHALCSASVSASLANLADSLLRQRQVDGSSDFPDEALRLLLARWRAVTAYARGVR